MYRSSLCRFAICRNLACLFLTGLLLLLGIAEVRYASNGGTDRYDNIQKLAWYGVILKANSQAQ
jgi:hypothetical protein